MQEKNKEFRFKNCKNAKWENKKLFACKRCKWIFNTPLYKKALCGFCFVRGKLGNEEELILRQENVISDLQSKKEVEELYNALKKLKKTSWGKNET